MIGVTLTGADGSAWDLRNGPVVLGAGAEGFGLPTFDRPTIESPNIDGQRLLTIGSRAKARSGILPCVLTPQETEADWLALQRAWWSAWSPDVPAVLTVTDPVGGTRNISAYLDSDDGYGLELDPTVNLFEQVPVSWIADDPWWRGPTQVTVLAATDAGDYLAGGTAPPLNLSSSVSTGTGTLSNTGDVPAWPLYTIGAGATAFKITVNGQTTAGTITVPTGGRLVINTDPTAQTALLIAADGTVTNVTPQLTSVDFAQVPLGGQVTVAVQLVSPSGATISVSIAPRFRRAF